MEPRVYLHSIAWELGTPRPIAELESLAGRELVREFLLGNGLRDYRLSDRPPPELAAAAIAKTLARARLAPAEVDAVVYASTSFQQRPWYTTDVSDLLAGLGMWNVTPIGVTLSECGNLAAALRVARGLITSGEHRTVLLVTADACATPAQRLVEPSVTVLSDGAACCVLSTGEPRGLALLGVQQTSNHKLRQVNPATESVKVLRYIAEGVRRAARGVLARLELAPEQVARLVPANLNRNVLQLFAAQCEIPFERTFTGNAAALGHVFASDGLINLDGAVEAGIAPGDRLLVVTNGLCNWGAAVLEHAGSAGTTR